MNALWRQRQKHRKAQCGTNCGVPTKGEQASGWRARQVGDA